MRIATLDQLATLSADELKAVIQNVENPVEVRRLARKRWNEIMKTQPRAQLYQTTLVSPDVPRSPTDED